MDIYTRWLSFLTIIFIVGFFAGMSRAIVNGKFQGVGKTLAWGVLTGFFSVAVVGYISEDPKTEGFRLGYYIALSAGTGVLGERAFDWVWQFYQAKLGVTDDTKKDNH